jgi:NAD(P)-dependent dehydrogenase (short-subunit alcohol dehydrogenase family)
VTERTTTERTAVVTGASSGIGKAIAFALADLGWAVGIGARRADRLAETAAEVERRGARVFAAPLDVRSPESVEEFLQGCEDALGPIDVLVNNAGITHIGWIVDTTSEEIRNVLDTNLAGAFYVTRWVVQRLLDRQSPGDVIFISSSAAGQPWPEQVLYGVAKSGLDALARGMQIELEGTGIRTTIVRVGAVESEIGAQLDPVVAQRAVEHWRATGALRNFAFVPVEQAAGVVAGVAAAPPEMWVREVHVEAVPPAEALTQEEMDLGTGRGTTGADPG